MSHSVYDVAIVGAAVGRSIPGMEVISDGVNGLTGRGGRHGERLKAFVISEAIGNSRKRVAVPTDEAGQRAIGAVRCAGDVVDAATAVDR